MEVGRAGGQLVMNLTESCLCRRQKPSRPQNCSSEDSQVLTDEPLQSPPTNDHKAQTAREGVEGEAGGGGRGGVIYLPSTSLFMDHTAGDGLKPQRPPEGDQRAFGPECLSSRPARTRLQHPDVGGSEVNLQQWI